MRSALSAAVVLILLAGCDSATEQKAPEDTTPIVEQLADGADIAGANGIHFGPDGNLYIASVVGSEIRAIDPDTGAVIKRYTAEDGVIGPDDVAFASDGAFYWTSILTGEVAGFTSGGERVVAAQLAPGVNPITFSDDDRLFVSQCFLEDDLFELDPAGESAPREIARDLGPGCGLNGMDWGPDDRLYGPRWFTGEVVSFDVDAGTMRVEASGLTVPAAVKFNSRGELHVLDTGAGEVVRVTGSGTESVATLEPGLDNFAFDSDDRIFVSSFADGFVKRVEPDGSLVALQAGGMSHAGGIVIRGDEAIAADLHAIRGYDVATGAITRVQRSIVGVGAMGGAMNIALDGNNLILTSWFDGDVRIWDPDNEVRVEHITDVSAPVSAVRYAGNIVIADHGTSSVVMITGASKQTVADEMPAPTALVVEQGDLYLSDRALGQILLLASDGEFREEPLVVADGLTTPEGFVVTNAGFVVFENDTGHVVEVDSAGSRRVLAEFTPGSQPGGPLQPPSQVFNGIARAPDGSLLVPGEIERALFRITY